MTSEEKPTNEKRSEILRILISAGIGFYIAERIIEEVMKDAKK